VGNSLSLRCEAASDSLTAWNPSGSNDFSLT